MYISYKFIEKCFLGSSVGIILPCDADNELYSMLEDILHGVIGERPVVIGDERENRRKREEPSIPTNISQRLISGINILVKICIKRNRIYF